MTIQALKALEPCPFCGGEAEISWSRDREIVNVRCVNWGHRCLGAGANCYNEAQATKAWNRRAREAYTGGSGDGMRALSIDEVERIILDTEPATLSDRGDAIWTRRMAVALAERFHSLALPAMEGWKLVPIEPTHEMTMAGLKAAEDDDTVLGDIDSSQGFVPPENGEPV